MELKLKEFDKKLLIFICAASALLLFLCIFAHGFLDSIVIGGVKLGGLILLLYHPFMFVVSLLFLWSAYQKGDE